VHHRAVIGCSSLLIIILAGCTMSDNRRADWSRVHHDPQPALQHDALSPTAPAPPLKPGVPPAVASSPSLTNGRPANHASLTEWSMSTFGIRPRKTAEGSGFTWQIPAPGGLLKLTPGSRQASCDGTLIWLAFAPVWLDGDCLVHELDLQKNLFPLATGRPTPNRERRIIVIDPGHGGSNHGTRSPVLPLIEKDLTLDWARRLGPLLQQQGWQVILTRTNDVDLSLAERVHVSERWGAHLFVSLHFNSAYPLTEHAGIETFCLTPTGMPSTLTRNYEDDLAHSLPNNQHDHDNLHFAFRFHHALVQDSKAPDRGVRRARFMGVLRNQKCPAVLIEAGYLSNPDEAQLIATPEYRQRLAESVARALANLAPAPASPTGRNALSTTALP
jgi:N-acetylmuramoyl-L-alanine amidase